MPIPRKEKILKTIWREPLLYKLLSAPCALTVAGFGGWKVIKDGYLFGWALFAVGFAIFILTILENIFSWRQKAAARSIHELEGCLHTLHAILTQGSSDVLRVTLHVPIDGGQKLEQVMDYVGGEPKSDRVGRRFAAQCGIIGSALRHKEAIVAVRENDNYEAFIHQMVKDWHYTEIDAKALNPGTRSWMAIPLLIGGEKTAVEAVVYLDSNNRDFFTVERQQIAINAAAGIARFVRQRYKP